MGEKLLSSVNTTQLLRAPPAQRPNLLFPLPFVPQTSGQICQETEFDARVRIQLLSPIPDFLHDGVRGDIFPSKAILK